MNTAASNNPSAQGPDVSSEQETLKVGDVLEVWTNSKNGRVEYQEWPNRVLRQVVVAGLSCSGQPVIITPFESHEAYPFPQDYLNSDSQALLVRLGLTPLDRRCRILSSPSGGAIRRGEYKKASIGIDQLCANEKLAKLGFKPGDRFEYHDQNGAVLYRGVIIGASKNGKDLYTTSDTVNGAAQGHPTSPPITEGCKALKMDINDLSRFLTFQFDAHQNGLKKPTETTPTMNQPAPQQPASPQLEAWQKGAAELEKQTKFKVGDRVIFSGNPTASMEGTPFDWNTGKHYSATIIGADDKGQPFVRFDQKPTSYDRSPINDQSKWIESRYKEEAKALQHKDASYYYLVVPQLVKGALLESDYLAGVQERLSTTLKPKAVEAPKFQPGDRVSIDGATATFVGVHTTDILCILSFDDEKRNSHGAGTYKNPANLQKVNAFCEKTGQSKSDRVFANGVAKNIIALPTDQKFKAGDRVKISSISFSFPDRKATVIGKHSDGELWIVALDERSELASTADDFAVPNNRKLVDGYCKGRYISPSARVFSAISASDLTKIPFQQPTQVAVAEVPKMETPKVVSKPIRGGFHIGQRVVMRRFSGATKDAWAAEYAVRTEFGDQTIDPAVSTGGMVIGTFEDLNSHDLLPVILPDDPSVGVKGQTAGKLPKGEYIWHITPNVLKAIPVDRKLLCLSSNFCISQEEYERRLKVQAQPAQAPSQKELNATLDKLAKDLNKTFSSFKEPEPMTAQTEFQPPSNPLVLQIKGDAINAGYRVATKQMMTMTKNLLVNLLHKAGEDSTKIQAIAGLLETEVGKALISLLLGMGLTYAPKVKDNPKAAKLATEFRVNGIAMVGNAAFETLLASFAPIMVGALETLANSEEEELKVRVSAPKTKSPQLSEEPASSTLEVDVPEEELSEEVEEPSKVLTGYVD